jgi:hypothetical protein
VKRGRGRPRKPDREVTPRARQARLRRLLAKLPDGVISDEDFHALMTERMWLMSPHAMKKMFDKFDEGVNEIIGEILKQAADAQKRLDEAEKREIEKLKDFVRNKFG